MQIESLKVFCDLIESRSFSQAAIRNYITQSAVSQQVKALEARYDTPLLTRDGRSILPTEAGKIFYEAAKEILARFVRMQTQLRSAGQEMVGSLRVASVYSVGLYEMTLPIRTFLKTYPRVNLGVEYSPANRVYEQVLSGGADLGIVTYPKSRKGIQVLSLPSDRLVLICTPEHPFARHRRIEIRKLDGESFIAFEKDTPSRQALDHIFEQHGIRVRVVMEFENIETIKRGVEIGAGIAIVPLLSVQREVESGSLVEVNLKGEDFYRPLGAVVKQRITLSPPAQKFIELLQTPRT